MKYFYNAIYESSVTAKDLLFVFAQAKRQEASERKIVGFFGSLALLKMPLKSRRWMGILANEGCFAGKLIPSWYASTRILRGRSL